MSRAASTLHLWVEFTSDWHVGTGVGVPGGVDRVVARDERGAPLIPASTLAGIVRDAAEDVAVGLGDGDPEASASWSARVVNLFGGVTGGGQAPLPSRLGFHRATVVPELLDGGIDPATLVQLRYATSIDPATGTAAQRTLRVVEVGRAGTVLHTTLDHPDLDDADELLLLAGLLSVRAVGAKRRRGLGRCRVHVGDVDPTTTLARLWERASSGVPPPPPADPSPPAALDAAPDGPGAGDARHLEVVLKLVEPVAAQERRLANELTTFDFIPGGLLLPALDAALGRRLGPSIASGATTIGDAVPAWPGPAGPVACLPAPRCLFAPKEETRGRDYTNRLHTNDGDAVQMKGLRGGWVAHLGDDAVAPVAVRTAGTAHAVIDDDLQRPTSDSGGLFVRHAIDAGQVFVSRVVTPAGLAEAIGELAGSTVRLGRATSRGQGLARIVAVRAADPPPTDSSGATRPGDEVVVLVAADVLVRSATNRLVPDAALLADALGGTLVTSPATDTAAFVATRRRESWHTGWGLPRPSLVAVAAGSVVRIRVEDAARFAAALAFGVGERTAEGFGRVLRAPFLEDRAQITRGEITGGPIADGEPGPTAPTPAIASLPRLADLLTTETQLFGFDLDARASAADLAGRLKLGQLSRTQLGDLRERARQAAAEGSLAPVGALLAEVGGNDNRAERWKDTLEPLRRWLDEQGDPGEGSHLRAATQLSVAVRHAQHTSRLARQGAGS